MVAPKYTELVPHEFLAIRLLSDFAIQFGDGDCSARYIQRHETGRRDDGKVKEATKAVPGLVVVPHHLFFEVL